MAAPSNFKAQIYIADVDATGILTSGHRDIGEAYPFMISFPQEITSVLGQMVDSEGKVIGAFPKFGVPSGSITFRDTTAHNVAQALGSVVVTETKSLVTLAAEEFTAPAVFGYWISILGHERITPGAVITNVAGDVTYKNFDDDPPNADYKIDYNVGLIMILSTGTITKGQTLKITGTVPARTEAVIDMRTAANPLRNIKATVINRATLEVALLELYCVRIVPSSDVGFSSESTDTPESFAFNLIPQLPRGGNSYGKFKGLPIPHGFSLT